MVFVETDYELFFEDLKGLLYFDSDKNIVYLYSTNSVLIVVSETAHVIDKGLTHIEN